MNYVPYSDTLVAWAAMAHREFRRTADAWVFSDGGSELRDILRVRGGVYELTFSSRMGREVFVMSAPRLEDIERRLTYTFGPSIRAERGLPFLYGARKLTDLKPGWAIDRTSSKWVLLSPNGSRRASFHDDEAVMFSWVADASLAELRASYLSGDGFPLFSRCWMGPETSGPPGWEPDAQSERPSTTGE